VAQQERAEERAQKSLYRSENPVFLKTLRAIRLKAGLTQGQLAERLGRQQSYVTNAERGVIRLDGLQIRDWAVACESDLRAWADLVEKNLALGSR
jgi:transcriptional regulator with XRE-family HTH domain